MLEKLPREMGQGQDEERGVDLIAETFGSWIQQMKFVNNTSSSSNEIFLKLLLSAPISSFHSRLWSTLK
jgi:hypothetical protein